VVSDRGLTTISSEDEVQEEEKPDIKGKGEFVEGDGGMERSSSRLG